MRSYTMIFAFDPSLTRVLLLKKSKPQWQAGKWSAPGGRVQDPEGLAKCASREMLEETNLEIPGSRMMYVLQFYCRYDGALHKIAVFGVVRGLNGAVGTPEEPVEIFPLENLPEMAEGADHLLALTLQLLKQSVFSPSLGH